MAQNIVSDHIIKAVIDQFEPPLLRFQRDIPFMVKEGRRLIGSPRQQHWYTSYVVDLYSLVQQAEQAPKEEKAEYRVLVNAHADEFKRIVGRMKHSVSECMSNQYQVLIDKIGSLQNK